MVYPAGHVYIYSFLYDLTNQGKDVLKGQWIFMALYLATLSVVLLCYREARVIISNKKKKPICYTEKRKKIYWLYERPDYLIASCHCRE